MTAQLLTGARTDCPFWGTCQVVLPSLKLKCLLVSPTISPAASSLSALFWEMRLQSLLAAVLLVIPILQVVCVEVVQHTAGTCILVWNSKQGCTIRCFLELLSMYLC